MQFSVSQATVALLLLMQPIQMPMVRQQPSHTSCLVCSSCIKRKQETIFCRDLVTEEMADCIVQLHCFTGCDANSGIYGKGKSSVYDKMAKSPVARRPVEIP